ncbi:MAG: hypothetical protein V1709_04290 [Planctomycetota bacterium]
MTNSTRVKIIKCPDGEEWAMIRSDKTMQDLTDEKPFSRWDPHYWHPKYENALKEMFSTYYPVESLGRYITLITYGSTKPRDYSSKDGVGVKYIRSVNVLFTGLNESDIHWIKEDGRLDGEQYRVYYKDIVMNKCGTGTSGRTFCYFKRDKVVVSQHTMLIRVENIEPSYIVVFMGTNYGVLQFEKYDKGTSGQTHIDFDDVKSIKMPILPEKVQSHIEAEYKKMSAYHDKAMDAKTKGDEANYKTNIQKAEVMLKDLITRTEAVIRGERKDI